jgi:hypothetical protein
MVRRGWIAMATVLWIGLATAHAPAAIGQGPGRLGLSASTVGTVHFGAAASSADSLPRTEWAKGMKIGGGIGFGVGALLGAAVVHMGDGPVSDGQVLVAAVLCGVVIGAIFAIIGGLIGSMFPQ